VGGNDAHESIMVEPNCIELHASDLDGAGLKKCIAGEQAEVTLMPRDALGNANASMSMEEGELSLRVVIQDRDGNQVATNMVPDVAKPGRWKVCWTSCCRQMPHVIWYELAHGLKYVFLE
jgi:hypothetical protein